MARRPRRGRKGARFRRAVLAGVALLLIALGAVMLLPRLVSHERGRAVLEAVASSVLGRPVLIAGPIQLGLLPQPTLRASGVTVLSAGNGLKLSSSGIEASLAPLPLLYGRIIARRLLLHHPLLYVPWPLPKALRTAPPLIQSFSTRIEDGTLLLGKVRLRHLTADIARATDGRGLILMASGEAGGTWHLSGRIGPRRADGSKSLALRLDGPGTLGLGFSGEAEPGGRFAGHLVIETASAALVAGGPSGSVKLEAEVTATPQAIAASRLSLAFSREALRGAGKLSLGAVPALTLELSATRLAFARFPLALPSSLPLGLKLDLKLDRLAFASGALDEVHAGLSIKGRTLLIEDASALLPGGGRLALSGSFVPGRGFDGSFVLNAPDAGAELAALIAAAGLKAPRLPAGHTLTLAGDATATSGSLALEHIAGTLDGASLSGTIGLTRGGSPAWTAALRLNSLDLTRWRASLDPARWAKEPAGELALALAKLSWRGHVLRRVHLDLGLGAGKLAIRRFNARYRALALIGSATFDAKGRIAQAELAATGDNATALAPLSGLGSALPFSFWKQPIVLQLAASGSAKALKADITLRLGQLSVTLAPLFDLENDTWQGPVTLRHPNAGRLLDRFGLVPVSALVGQGSFSLVASARAGPRALDLSRFSLIAGCLHAEGSLSTLYRERGGRVSLAGQISTDDLPLPASGPSLLAIIKALKPWRASLELAARQVTLGGREEARDMVAVLALGRRIATIDLLRAEVAGGLASGRAELDWREQVPKLSLSGAVTGVSLPGLIFGPVDVAGGAADITADVTAAGYTLAAMRASLTGALDLDLSGGVLRGVDLAGLDRALRTGVSTSVLAATLGGGSTPLSALSLRAQAVAGTLHVLDSWMEAQAGRGRIEGSIGLEPPALAVVLRFTPTVPDPPTISLQLTGDPLAPTRTPGLAAALAWRWQRKEVSP